MKNKTFCAAHGITVDQFHGRETVGGYLYLPSLASIPEGFNPTVGGNLCLDGLTSIPEGFNPTVGGSLYLDGLTSIPEGFNPTVGGSLYLDGLTSIPEGFNPTVGESLYLDGAFQDINSDVGLLTWRDGRYILIDGILGEAVSKKKGYWKLRKIGKDETFYAATDGEGSFAHGETLLKAREDLRFKIAAEKLKKEPIRADTMITVEYYRALTGACEMGVDDFKRTHGLDKEAYPASELLPILERHNAYGLDVFRKMATF